MIKRIKKRPNGQLDINAIVEEIWNRLLSGYSFTHQQMREAYGLESDQQFRKVIKRLRALGDEHAKVFGYRQSNERYTIAWSWDQVEEILTWDLEHWLEAGNSAHHGFSAAFKAGFVSQNVSDSVQLVRDDFEARITALRATWNQEKPKKLAA